MSYYFPFGNSSLVVNTNVSYSISAVTASRPQFASIVVPTASFVTSVINAPASGTIGVHKSASDCTSTSPVGAQGVTGQQGDMGSSYTVCPPGTKECPGLFTSLSLFVNPNRASGSQFSIVCIETAGYVYSSVGCPDYLPTSSNPNIPAIP